MILVMNISLNFLNVSLSVLFCLRFEMIKRFLKLSLLFSFHSCEFNFNEILFLSECLLKTLAILLPSHKLKFILQLFFTYILHLIQIFIKLRHLDVSIFDLFFSWVINGFNLLLILIHSIILNFLISFLKSLNLIF